MNKEQLQATLEQLKSIYLDVINFPNKELHWLEGTYNLVNDLFNEVYSYGIKQRNFTDLQEESSIISQIYKYEKFIKKNINEVLKGE